MGESAGPAMAEVFGRIYEQHEWTGESKSGPGSVSVNSHMKK
jgi:hypothetical protein